MADYEKLWASEKFRKDKCRTLFHADVFLSIYSHIMRNTNALSIGVARTLIDWGCGNGSHSMEFIGRGIEVVGMNDIASNCLDDATKDVFCNIFEAKPLCEADPIPAHFSYCVDVLEHLEEDDIDDSIKNIVAHTELPGFIFVNVSTERDMWHDVELHKTVKDFYWWTEKLRNLIPGQSLFSYNLMNKAYGTFWYLPVGGKFHGVT